MAERLIRHTIVVYHMFCNGPVIPQRNLFKRVFDNFVVKHRNHA